MLRCAALGSFQPNDSSLVEAGEVQFEQTQQACNTTYCSGGEQQQTMFVLTQRGL